MSQVISIGYLALLLVLCMSTRPNQSAQVLKKSSAKLSNETIKDKVDDFLLAILRCHNIPGANLALVHHGQIMQSQGYGFSNIETRELFTNQTRVLIASLTKAFVSTLIASTLQRKQNVSWDTPVRSVLGDWFVLSDAVRTERLTVRDVLSHRSGLPRNDPLLLAGYSTQQLLQRMRYLTFTHEWRETGKYNNLMYGVAAAVVEAMEGEQWETVAYRRLLHPLNMRSTAFISSLDTAQHNFAASYSEDDSGTLKQLSIDIARLYSESTNAPGSLSSTAEDMAQWLVFNVNEGADERGNVLLPGNLLAQLHVPSSLAPHGVVMSQPQFPVTYTLDKYGLGWLEGYYNGYAISQHSGNQAGFASMITLIPHLKAGIYTTFNRDDAYIRDLLHVYIMDLLLGNEPWITVDNVCNKHITRTLQRSRKERRLGMEGASEHPDSVAGLDGNDDLKHLVLSALKEANKTDLILTNEALKLLFTPKQYKENGFEALLTKIVNTNSGDSNLHSTSLFSQQSVVQPSGVNKQPVEQLAGVDQKRHVDRRVRRNGRRSAARRRQEQVNELRQYEGKYGEAAYGTVRVRLQHTGTLVLEYGQVSWQLVPVMERLFQAVGNQPFWYWTMIVVFDMHTDGNAYQLYVPFEREVITIFRRDFTSENGTSSNL